MTNDKQSDLPCLRKSGGHLVRIEIVLRNADAFCVIHRSCGVASAFQLAVINQDGSVSGNYASVIEPLETNFYRYMSWTSNATAAEVFRFDSQCRLVDSQGYKADAVWTTSALQSPIWLDSEELHIDYNGVYGDCKSQDGMLVCSFAPAGEMSLCDYGDVRPHHLAGARSDLTSKSPGFDGCN